jgi:hypothetical protein
MFEVLSGKLLPGAVAHMEGANGRKERPAGKRANAARA